MNGNFRLGIELGNDAMQDHADIAEALENLASHLRRFGFEGDVEGSIRDANGNTVGSWDLEEEVALLTEAQQERIAKIETYGDARVGILGTPNAVGAVHVEIIRDGKGTSYFTLDANGRLHALADH